MPSRVALLSAKQTPMYVDYMLWVSATAAAATAGLYSMCFRCAAVDSVCGAFDGRGAVHKINVIV